MTTFDRFDPFERRIGAAMDDIAGTRALDYLDDVFRRTARTSQRPRWSFPERWFNVDTTLARPVVAGRRVPFRSLLLLVVLAALLAAAGVYFGSQRQLPAPYGPAGNGHIVFSLESDLYIVDSITGQPRLLLAAEGRQGGAVYSPDGSVIAYDNVVSGADHIWVVNRDGTNPRRVMDKPYTGISFAWSPDSKLMAATTNADGPHELWLAPADGSGATLLDLGPLFPWDAQWDPLRPNVLLVRAEDVRTKVVDLYFVDLQGTVLSKLGVSGQMLYGAEYEFAGLAISPDGQTIAYNAVEPDVPGFEHFRAHLVNRDGTNDREVVLPAPIQSPYSKAWPVFSPDGEFIAMESWVTQPDGSAVNQIALARTDGTAPTRLVGPSIPGVSMVKTWAPDGTTLLMHANGIDDVYAIDPVTGTHELLPWKSDFPNWQRVAK
jgi:Tol biopolymer transport system component